jgi:alpha-beta hydrolase superfamily lysophospholipase
VPHFEGVCGQVYYKAFEVPDPLAAVVFLHGFGEHSGLYHRFGRSLNARGIDLFALDEIGHGLSDGDRAVIDSIDDLVANADRLIALVGAALPGVPLVLAGHSLGAAAAAVRVSRRSEPLAGLVLSGSLLSPAAWVEGLAAAGDQAALSLDLDDLSADPFYRDELINDPLAFTSASGAQSLVKALPPAWAELESSFGHVELPVLFIHGGLDPVAPPEQARQWAATLRFARFSEFAGARHDILNETVHAEVAAEIAGFVLEVAGAASRADGRSAEGP